MYRPTDLMDTYNRRWSDDEPFVAIKLVTRELIKFFFVFSRLSLFVVKGVPVAPNVLSCNKQNFSPHTY